MYPNPVDVCIRELERQSESYWDKLTRISKSPYSLLFRTDHHGFGDTTYVLIMDQSGIHKIRAATMNQMERS